MPSLEEKLTILGDAAKFDASCSSSGSSRPTPEGSRLGNPYSAGICHTWAADGRCVSLLKVLQSNACLYDCAYCQNRRSNPTPRATFTPEELAELTIQFYRRNYIEGLFLSSGVVQSPDYTMELMIRTMQILRQEHRFGGYIHVKVIPGSDARLVHAAGLLADRMSCNIELPSSDSLALLAPQKRPEGIFAPMQFVRSTLGMCLEDKRKYIHAPSFAPAGQTTQMIVGATRESDLAILRLSHGLYRKYQMKRVYFSAYIPVGAHPALPPAHMAAPPLLREHRLYQADWLLRFYSFTPDELLEDCAPQLDPEMDPKSQWALKHPEFFPVEVNTVDYETLLRVPGLGVQSARRIIEARRQGSLRPEDLKKLGVLMKRAQFFLTAGGKFTGRVEPGHPMLREQLVQRPNIHQLSLFDPPVLLPAIGDRSAVTGQM